MSDWGIDKNCNIQGLRRILAAVKGSLTFQGACDDGESQEIDAQRSLRRIHYAGKRMQGIHATIHKLKQGLQGFPCRNQISSRFRHCLEITDEPTRYSRVLPSVNESMSLTMKKRTRTFLYPKLTLHRMKPNLQDNESIRRDRPRYP